MITFFRWILIKQKEIKWKLAFYRFWEQLIKEFRDNPEALSEKLILYLDELIRTQTAQEKNAEKAE